MTDLKKIWKYEAFTISALIIIYTIRQLLEAADHFDTLVINGKRDYGLSSSVILADLSGYSHGLNAMFPIIAGTLLLTAGWFVFHFLAYPEITGKTAGNKLFIYFSATAMLVFSGVIVFHYFREYVQYTYKWVIATPRLQVDGFKVYSLYRKKTIFSDAVGFIILFGMYEMLAQIYYYLFTGNGKQTEASDEGGSNFHIGYLFPLPLVAFLVYFALYGTLPNTLFLYQHIEWVVLCGAVLLVLVLQSIFFNSILLVPFNNNSAVKISNITVYILVCIAGCFILTLFANSPAVSKTTLFAILMVLSLSTSAIIAWVRRVFTAESRVLSQQVSATSAELASLRAQINPHFLFNALNSLYTAALKEGSEHTADGIQKLGDMMRFMLHDNNRERIELNKEIEYLNNYIHIQRIRIDESQGVEIRIDIQQPYRAIYIAPMMLIPFVENAFKHGVSHIHPSWIYITLSLDEAKLYFKVHNSFHKHRETDPVQDHSGVGLENVRRRLSLIYPYRHELEIRQTEKDYVVGLTISLE